MTTPSSPIDPRLYDLHVEALAEIKATVDGESDQPVKDIIYGLLSEIEALPARTGAEAPQHLVGPYKTDPYGIKIYGTSAKDGGDTIVLDIRGWGYLTGLGHGALGLSHSDAAAEQIRFANWVVEALNEAHRKES